VRFEVLKVATVKTAAFQDVKPCILVEGHSVTSQKMIMFRFGDAVLFI
jgi:hypothetical protein